MNIYIYVYSLYEGYETTISGKTYPKDDGRAMEGTQNPEEFQNPQLMTTSVSLQ